MKRANGSGTVRKLPGHRRKPWAVYRPATYDEYGICRQEFIGSFETKKEAELALANDALRPKCDCERITLSALWERWKATRAYTQLSKSGQQGYDASFKYMSDYHETRFRDIRRDDWQAMIDKADDLGKSESTMTKLRALCGILSEYAVSLDVIPHTYASRLIVPKREKKEILTFTREEIDTLFAHKDEPIVDSILIMIYTGMRISELLSIKKTDVDLVEMLIVGGVKTDAGRNRTIPVHTRIQPLIAARIFRSKEFLIEENGKKMRPEHYRDLYFSALERLGIRRLTPHKARHTFFTMLDAATQDKLAMAIVGGHTDPNFSEKTYVHPDIDRLRNAVSCIQ